jgi:hypothetical protein
MLITDKTSFLCDDADFVELDTKPFDASVRVVLVMLVQRQQQFCLCFGQVKSLLGPCYQKSCIQGQTSDVAT